MTDWQSEQAHDLTPLHSEPQAFRNALKPVQTALYSEISTDDGEPPFFRRQTTTQKYFGGISRTLRAFASVACIVLIINLSWLIYNSLVFSSLSGNEYYYSVVTEDFLTGAPFNLTGDWQPRFMQDPKTGMIPKISKTQGPPNGAHVDPFDVAIAVERLQTMVELYSNMQNEASTWERLENK
ncbi:uncharacterized protein RSE6_10487 [Rhynchosporium secalis]|uniref:Uncharacterized protein n=1 Tax=Rhynchosporium secalis TaxID=38038 RepID=A0A1E1MKK7_RHYSE|nr:uncharacterized protein RSE6_10487 [Rhynchosporium secalis]